MSIHQFDLLFMLFNVIYCKNKDYYILPNKMISNLMHVNSLETSRILLSQSSVRRFRIDSSTVMFVMHVRYTYKNYCCKACRTNKNGNRFGKDCEYYCSGNDGPKRCHGKLFCLPDPYGCSCDVGIKGLACDEGNTVLLWLILKK